MKEAMEKGYLGAKLITPKTIKFSDEMLDAVSVYAEAESISDVDWMRTVIAEALLIADAKYERTRRAKERSSKHWDTLAHQQKSPVAGTTELVGSKPQGE